MQYKFKTLKEAYNFLEMNENKGALVTVVHRDENLDEYYEYANTSDDMLKEAARIKKAPAHLKKVPEEIVGKIKTAYTTRHDEPQHPNSKAHQPLVSAKDKVAAAEKKSRKKSIKKQKKSIKK